MAYTNEFVNFYAGYQHNVPSNINLKDSNDNIATAFFFKTPNNNNSLNANTSLTTTGYEVAIDRVFVNYTETFTEWSLSASDSSNIIFNFDPIIIPSNGNQINFNGVEIISSVINPTNVLPRQITFTRIANDPSGLATYSTNNNNLYKFGHRVYLPNSSTTYSYLLKSNEVPDEYVTNEIPGVAIGESINVINANNFTIARFIYDQDIILPITGGISFDVGSLKVNFQTFLINC